MSRHYHPSVVLFASNILEVRGTEFGVELPKLRKFVYAVFIVTNHDRCAFDYATNSKSDLLRFS